MLHQPVAVVGVHHLAEHVVGAAAVRLHHVHGEAEHVRAALLDPRHRTLRDLHQLAAQVHMVVGDAERLGHTLQHAARWSEP